MKKLEGPEGFKKKDNARNTIDKLNDKDIIKVTDPAYIRSIANIPIRAIPLITSRMTGGKKISASYL